MFGIHCNAAKERSANGTETLSIVADKLSNAEVTG